MCLTADPAVTVDFDEDDYAVGYKILRTVNGELQAPTRGDYVYNEEAWNTAEGERPVSGAKEYSKGVLHLFTTEEGARDLIDYVPHSRGLVLRKVTFHRKDLVAVGRFFPKHECVVVRSLFLHKAER